MNKNKIYVVLTLILLVILWQTNAFDSRASGSSTTANGTVDDPLVTKSYVDQKISEISKGQATTGTVSTAQPSSDPGSSGSALTIVQLKAGQTLYFASGAEAIVRTGKTQIVSSDENGVPDVTTGTDLTAGAAVPTNHLLIYPREGRGIKADPKNNQDIYVMVRGGYTLYNADGTAVTP